MQAVQQQIEESLTNFKTVGLHELNELNLLDRIDQKHVFLADKIPELLQDVAGDYLMLEINGQRISAYNTTYFDDPNFTFYLNHQTGRRNRYKIRQRTYEVNHKSFLELKQKTNTGKTQKKRIETDFSEFLNERHYQFLEQFIPFPKRDLIKSSTNKFKRITLVSFKHKERITIDFNLLVAINEKEIALNKIAIAEVKQTKPLSKTPFIKALKRRQIYPRSFSKYCMGLALLKPDLKQNRFKENKIFIHKLMKYDTVSY